MLNKWISVILFFILWWTGTACYGSEIRRELKKIKDDAEETSGMVEKEKRFVPVPIPISDPTIGTGLGIAGLYLHPQKEGDTVSPTTISGAFGLYTDSDSWLLGIFHDGYYMKDRYRAGGALGYGEFNLKFYGIGDDSDLRGNPLDYTARGTIVTPRLFFHLPWDHWFAGARVYYLNLDISLEKSRQISGVPELSDTSRTAGLGLVGLYDSRDVGLWASDGTLFEVMAMDYGKTLGGEFEYQKYTLKLVQFFPVHERVTLAYRLDGEINDGDAPFYDLAGVKLRGFPGGFYLNSHAVTAQGEARWNFYRKWTALAFGGGGRTAEDVSGLGSGPTRYAWGGGLRYMIAEKQKLMVGADFAYGDDKFQFYVQIGDWFAN